MKSALSIPCAIAACMMATGIAWLDVQACTPATSGTPAGRPPCLHAEHVPALFLQEAAVVMRAAQALVVLAVLLHPIQEDLPQLGRRSGSPPT